MGIGPHLVFAAAIVLSVANDGESYFKAMPLSAPLAWLGMILYSLYMAHYPVIHAFHVAMRRFLDLPKAIIDGQPVVQLPALPFMVTVLLLLSTVLLVSALSYYFVERPARDWSRRVAAAE